MISTETENELDWLDLVSPVPDTSKLQAREYIHMDFGFPRGKKKKRNPLEGS